MRESAIHLGLSLQGTGRTLWWVVKKWKIWRSLRILELLYATKVEAAKILGTAPEISEAMEGVGSYGVLLYSCETWKITQTDKRKLNSFQWQCPRRKLRIRWLQRMTNKRVVELAGINEISCEVRRRRWNSVGHVLRREGVNDCFTALGWTPEILALCTMQLFLGPPQVFGTPI